MKRDSRVEQFIESRKPFDFKSYEIHLSLETPSILYDPLHLDGILAKSMVTLALEGGSLESSVEPYYLPLPLECEWVSKEGLPLWKSTDFIPIGDNEIQNSFWHKRSPRDSKFLKSAGGKKSILKEYRVSMPMAGCLDFWARFVGDMGVVSELLSKQPTVGKKTSQGYGIVKSWDIEEIEDFSFYSENKKPLRPIPIKSLDVYSLNELSGQLKAYTPPYWHHKTMDLCIG